ncbi:MAG TPA: sigma-54 dependent transcriptional regulator, partial [Myxococcaceae bacterium]|nr:sigma-54 dependent transcriptional regulator [Myxococcaceae bacterium]
MPSGHVLVVDDDEAVGKVLVALLHQAGIAATWVGDGAQALAYLDKKNADAVVADIRMPVIDGMQLLSELGRKLPDLPVLMLTAHGTVPLAVEAMKRGAVDFLLKPFDRDEILLAINKALARPTASTIDVSSSGIGESEAMSELWTRVARVAATETTVLVRGETGTGKALVAQAIHEQSRRAKGPFITVQCAGFPESLLESEVFGYEKGAFTGAAQRRAGRIESAHGGTLFLDEVGDLPLDMQGNLLRFLQE